MDLDVPLGKPSAVSRQPSAGSVVLDDFRLKVGLPTLKLCLEHASEVIVMGHIGRPNGREVPELSVAPIYDWLEEELGGMEGLEGKLRLLENLRFEPGESFDTAQAFGSEAQARRDEDAVLKYAEKLAALGDVFVNEAFAAHHPAASTTVLPTLLPHTAGLNFAKEVEILTRVRENPGKPLVIIIGGAKVEDKFPVVLEMAKIADYVLVGGKIAGELSAVSSQLSASVLVGKLNEEGTDITPETIDRWQEIIREAKMIVWNGPLGKIEDPKNDQTKRLAEMIVSSDAETVVGGGDTVTYLDQLGLLDKFSFVSAGGGAMLELLATGTLPTIEVLN